MMAKDDKTQKVAMGLEPIKADAVYPLEVFKRYTGLEDWAMRTLRRRGLTTIRIGNRRFVHGAEFIRVAAAKAANDSKTSEMQGKTRPDELQA